MYICLRYMGSIHLCNNAHVVYSSLYTNHREWFAHLSTQIFTHLSTQIFTHPFTQITESVLYICIAYMRSMHMCNNLVAI